MAQCRRSKDEALPELAIAGWLQERFILCLVPPPCPTADATATQRAHAHADAAKSALTLSARRGPKCGHPGARSGPLEHWGGRTWVVC